MPPGRKPALQPQPQPSLAAAATTAVAATATAATATGGVDDDDDDDALEPGGEEAAPAKPAAKRAKGKAAGLGKKQPFVGHLLLWHNCQGGMCN